LGTSRLMHIEQIRPLDEIARLVEMVVQQTEIAPGQLILTEVIVGRVATRTQGALSANLALSVPGGLARPNLAVDQVGREWVDRMEMEELIYLLCSHSRYFMS
jgi:hypothetical protein